MSSNLRYGNRDVLNFVLKDIITKEPILYLTSLKTSELQNQTATVYATGGSGNPELIGWTGSRQLTLNCTDALVSAKSFAIFAGSHTSKLSKLVHEKEALKVKPIPATITDAPTGATMYVEIGLDNDVPKHGAEADATHPIFVYRGEVDGASIMVDEDNKPIELTKTSTTGTVSRGNYEITDYTPEVTGATPAPAISSKLFFSGDDVIEDDVVIIDYYYTEKVTSFAITSKDFPGTYFAEGYTLFRDEAGKDHIARMTVPKAKLIGDFTIPFHADGDPATFAFTLKALKPLDDEKMIIMDITDDYIDV